MPSTFLNLLRYARSSEIEATEDFTTEALAACIRSDPAPVLFLLERLSVIGSAGEVAEVVALTQVMEVGAGIIDLVLQLRLPDRLMEVWIEVKVAAGESGNQIDNYRRFIESQPDGLRPQLVTLSRWPIRPDPDLTWLAWQAVRAQALTSAEPYWRDLAAFLEDIDMADEFDAPTTSREAASLADAARLLGKTGRILLPVFDQARRSGPRWRGRRARRKSTRTSPFGTGTWAATRRRLATTHVLRPKGGVRAGYLAAVLRSPSVLRQLVHVTTGSTHPRVLEEDARDAVIPIPSGEVQAHIEARMSERATRSSQLREEAERDWDAALATFGASLLR